MKIKKIKLERVSDGHRGYLSRAAENPRGC